MPKISGLWTPIRNPDGSVDNTPWEFHIAAKNKFREMFNRDPHASGSALTILKELMFNEKLATRDPNEPPVINELFVCAMLDDYDKAFELYKPGRIEKSIYPKVRKFTIALMRVDSAYYERMMGIMGYLIANHEKFADIRGNHLEVLQSAREFWEENDNRDRTKAWIAWIFNFAINKYQTEKFYTYSINHMLQFMHVNADKWVFHEAHFPDAWFCNGRGAQVNALYGGNF